jgi:hypothetical protein
LDTPYTSSWLGTQLSTRTASPFTFTARKREQKRFLFVAGEKIRTHVKICTFHSRTVDDLEPHLSLRGTAPYLFLAVESSRKVIQIVHQNISQNKATLSVVTGFVNDTFLWDFPFHCSLYSLFPFSAEALLGWWLFYCFHQH